MIDPTKYLCHDLLCLRNAYTLFITIAFSNDYISLSWVTTLLKDPANSNNGQHCKKEWWIHITLFFFVYIITIQVSLKHTTPNTYLQTHLKKYIYTYIYIGQCNHMTWNQTMQITGELRVLLWLSIFLNKLSCENRVIVILFQKTMNKYSLRLYDLWN